MLPYPPAIFKIEAADDREFMEQLYKDHYRLMFRTVWMYAKQQSDCEDIVSASCEFLLHKLPLLRQLSPEKLRSYIVTTVKNTSINHCLKAQRNDKHTTADADEKIRQIPDRTNVEGSIVLKEEVLVMLKAVETLPLNEQYVLRMKFMMDMNDAQIAAVLGLSQDSIRKYVARARDKIRAIIYKEDQP